MSADIEIAVEVRHETDKAIQIFDGKNVVWIPRSMISDYSETGGKITSIFISEWLATEKGLI